MRDHSDSRTLPLSLGKPRRQRNQQSGAAFLPPLTPAEAQEREFQQERIGRALQRRDGSLLGLDLDA